MQLDMAEIYVAEGRLKEVAIVTPRSAPDLMAAYNSSANDISKYLSWVKYERLSAHKELELAKAEVIIDRLPEAAARLRDTGIKPNEDFRAALIAKDPKCSALQEKLNAIDAITALLEGKFWSFIRAYNAVEHMSRLKDSTINANINATPGMTLSSDGFMGQSRIVEDKNG
jgi:hypothetical protein